MNRGRRDRASVAVGLLVGLLVVAGCTRTEEPSVKPSPVAGSASADGSSVATAVGVTVYPADRAPALPVLTGADLTGATLTVPVPRTAVTVVNVWASWCSPCVEEMPKLKAVSTRFAADDVRVVGVATRDRTAAAASFLSASGFDLPSLADRSGAQAARLSPIVPTSAVPSTLVVDSSGRVRARWIGPVDAVRLGDEVCATLREEKSPAASCPG